MQDYPSNSFKSRERAEAERNARPERVERITSAEADRRKRGLGQKFRGTFINGSSRMAFDYMIMEVVIPAVQDTLIDALQGGIERFIKGDSPGRRRRGYVSSAYSNVPHVDYQGISTGRRPPTAERSITRQSRAKQTFDDIIIASRPEAEEVLDQMYEYLSRFGFVRVSELYEMTGIRSDHTDTKWGWTALTGARVGRLSDGRFYLNLPEPQML